MVDSILENPQVSIEQIDNPDAIYGVISLCAQDLLVNKGNNNWASYYDIDTIKHKLANGTYLGLNEGDNLIGVVHISGNMPDYYRENDEGVDYSRVFNPDLEPSMYISSLGVLPNTQKKGYGRLLEQAAETFARDNGAKSVRLDAIETNYLELIQFYKKLGFIKKGDMPNGDDNYILFEKAL